MSVTSELAAIRAIARSLSSASRPPEPRRLRAWGSALSTAVRGIERAQPASQERGSTYDGMTLTEVLCELSVRVVRLVGLEVSDTHATYIIGEAEAAQAAIRASAPAQRPRPVDADTVGATRRDAASTSRAAALHVLPKTGSQRRRVLQAVAAVARDPRVVGLTDVELARQTGMSPNSERPRRVELVKGGWLEAGEQTREHYGQQHTVWVLTAQSTRATDLWAP